MWVELKIKRASLMSHLRKLPKVCFAHKNPHLPQLFNSVVKVDFVQQTHHYCTETWHAEGSSLKLRHREEGRTSVKPVEFAVHLQHKLRIE